MDNLSTPFSTGGWYEDKEAGKVDNRIYYGDDQEQATSKQGMIWITYPQTRWICISDYPPPAKAWKSYPPQLCINICRL